MDSRIKQPLLVWDKHGEPQTDQQILLWNGYTETKNQRSILKSLEENSDQLRSNYLAFIRDLGQIHVHDKRVVEHLMIEKGFSLWWMSLLAEKGTLKSETPLNCLKLLALNQILIKDEPALVKLISNNKSLGNSLSLLCKSLNILFHWEKPFIFQSFSLNNIGKKLPHIIHAPIYLVRNICAHWSLRKSLNTNWLSGNNSTFFFSYFLNMDLNALKKGKFLSKYWGTLPDLIKKSGNNMNWIHHFMVSVDVPDTKTGIKYLKAFNENSKNQGCNNFLFSFLTFKIVIKTIIMWFRTAVNIALIQSSFNKQVSKHIRGWIWPIMREDWKSSVYGKTAIQNIIWAYLLDKAMSSLPQQKTGLYLCENQGWERAFIHYWKKYNHGEIIGFAHSMIRYWDLRYFDDLQTWQSKDALAQPLPDKIALNGPAAFKAYCIANQPKNRLVEVEAIRYQHLGLLKRKSNSFSSNSDKKKLLVIGDYVTKTTHHVLRLLDCLEQSTLVKYEIIFKPHPAAQSSIDHYKKFKLQETALSLDKLIPKVDVILSTGNTTAVVEPLIAGIPVIVAIENDNFNFSPLRGEKGINFIKSSKELKTVLETIDSASIMDFKNKYFWLDSALPRWKSLLGLDQKETAEKINTTIS